ncbi:MAG: archease [Gammaproteobacteria bacterium]|nr:archease [Gammaproteobacteria bacterium]
MDRTARVALLYGLLLIYTPPATHHHDGRMQNLSWSHIEHDADIGLRARAPSRESLFEAMGEALTAVVTDPASVRPEQQIEIQCEAPDDALLLVDWLNALIYEMATRRMLFGNWRVTLDGHKLDALVEGEAVDRARHLPVVEIKGATYTALSVKQDSSGNWHAQCVVDV